MREQQVEKQLRDKVRELGGEAYKFESLGNNGMPDRLIILPGGIIHLVELKRPKGGILSKIQKFQHRKLKKMNVDVHVVSTPDEIETFITKCKLEMKLHKGGA